jgi:hypothetical protein
LLIGKALDAVSTVIAPLEASPDLPRKSNVSPDAER